MLLVTNIGSVRSVLAPTRRCTHMVDGAGARTSIAGAALVSGGAELVGGHPPWTRSEGSVCGPSRGGREELGEPGGILQNREAVIAHPEDGLRSTGAGVGGAQGTWSTPARHRSGPTCWSQSCDVCLSDFHLFLNSAKQCAVNCWS